MTTCNESNPNAIKPKTHTPKAIFFDLDGTLLSNGKLIESAKKALLYAKEKGVMLFIATGRHKIEVDIMPWLPCVSFDGFVTMNGAYSYIGDEVVHTRTIAKDTVTAVAEYLTKTQQYGLFCEANNMYASILDERAIAFQAQLGLKIPPVRDPRHAVNADIYQIVVFGEEIKGLLQRLSKCEITSWADNCYDIVPAGINKWVGILPMLAKFGLDPKDVATIGDGPNDIEMLMGAGYSVAMGNGPDNVKAHADYITRNVEDDGILEAIEHLLGCEI